MTPDLIFGIAFSIIALFVLFALMATYLNRGSDAIQSIIGLFILLCGVILISAVFFAKHVEIEYKRDLLKAADTLTIDILSYEDMDSLLNKNDLEEQKLREQLNEVLP